MTSGVAKVSETHYQIMISKTGLAYVSTLIIVALWGSSVSCHPLATSADLRNRALADADIARLDTQPAPPSVETKGAEVSKSWVEVPVHYATRRDIQGGKDLEGYYGGNDDTLKYGVATVTIPDHYRPGKEDMRGYCRFLPGPLSCKREPSNAVTLGAIDELSAQSWLRSLNALTAASDTIDALVYVHGYNNSFVDAVERAAELSYDIGFGGVALAYDWSSRNNIPDYAIDQETAERSVPDFKKFLLRVADSAHVRRIAIVAHSMGTRLVSYAMRDLASERPALRLGAVVFAASDVDSAIFVDQMAASVSRGGHPVTLYASSRDKVIRLSANVVHAARRVGSGPPSIISREGIEYVDASAIDTDLLGHGYFAENVKAVNDLYLVIRYLLSAKDRHLPTVTAGSTTYYRLP